MADYASIIGGNGDHIGIYDIPKDAAAYYSIGLSSDVFLDHSDSSASNQVDAHDISYTVEVHMGSGADTIVAGSGNDSIYGGAGSDSISTGDGENSASGGQGDDTIISGVGDSTLVGGNGNDSVGSQGGDNYISGDNGDDTVFGGDGNDTILGGTGNDFLNGYGGNDQLLGGSGDDTLIGAGGDDMLTGGSGKDVFYFDSNFGHDVITDLGKSDQIWLQKGLNGLVNSAEDLAQPGIVSGGVGPGGTKFTVITIGNDSIKLMGVDKDDFLSHLSTYVKIIGQ